MDLDSCNLRQSKTIKSKNQEIKGLKAKVRELSDKDLQARNDIQATTIIEYQKELADLRAKLAESDKLIRKSVKTNNKLIEHINDMVRMRAQPAIHIKPHLDLPKRREPIEWGDFKIFKR